MPNLLPMRPVDAGPRLLVYFLMLFQNRGAIAGSGPATTRFSRLSPGGDSGSPTANASTTAPITSRNVGKGRSAAFVPVGVTRTSSPRAARDAAGRDTLRSRLFIRRPQSCDARISHLERRPARIGHIHLLTEANLKLIQWLELGSATVVRQINTTAVGGPEESFDGSASAGRTSSLRIGQFLQARISLRSRS